MEAAIPAYDQKGIMIRKTVYAAITGFLLLAHLYMMVTYWEKSIGASQAYSIPIWIWILRTVAGTLALSFPELLKEALQETVDGISAAYHGDLSLIKNRSYLTGLDLDDERNTKEETYTLLKR